MYARFYKQLFERVNSIRTWRYFSSSICCISVGEFSWYITLVDVVNSVWNIRLRASSYADSDCGLLPIWSEHSIQIAFMASVDKCTGHQVCLCFTRWGMYLQHVQFWATNVLCLASKEELLYHALHHDMIEVMVSHSFSSNWWIRRVGRRKLYSQRGSVGFASAVSIYSSIGSIDLGPVEWREPFQMWWCNIVIGTQGLYPVLTIENTIQPTICGSHIHF